MQGTFILLMQGKYIFDASFPLSILQTDMDYISPQLLLVYLPQFT